jgi:hypothetical protein
MAYRNVRLLVERIEDLRSAVAVSHVVDLVGGECASPGWFLAFFAEPDLRLAVIDLFRKQHSTFHDLSLGTRSATSAHSASKSMVGFMDCPRSKWRRVISYVVGVNREEKIAQRTADGIDRY